MTRTSRTLFVILCALASCGRDAPPPARAQHGRLELTSDLPVDTQRAPRVVRTQRFTPEDDAFEVRAGEGTLVLDPRAPAGSEEWVLSVRGEGPRELVIPGRFEPGSFERVALELTTGRFSIVQVAALLADGKRLNSRAVGVDGTPGPQAVVLDLPHLRLAKVPVEELSILFLDKGGELGVHRVDWISQPASGWLPHVGAPPRPIQLGAETRLAQGLTSEERVSARFSARRGDLLSFSYAVPRDFGLLGAPLRLELRVEGGGETIERTYELPDLHQDARWEQASLELDAVAGEEARVTFSLSSASRAIGVCALADVRVRAPQAAAPLVFLMTSDTHRADHVGAAAAGVEVDTPTLDGLAARGVWFSNCWASANVTNPSHVALLTGVHPRDHGVVTNSMQLADQASTLAEVFRDAGWVTFGVVSNSSLGPLRCGLEQGFDRFAVPELLNPGDAAEAVDRLLSWWPAAQGAPLFCWLHVFDAHEPYLPPEPALVERYYPADKDPFDVALPPLAGVDDAILPASLRGLRDLDWPRAAYRAEITYLDRELGRLLARPRFDDAIVGITADHGESFEAHGIYYSHADLYPDSLHVPMILSWPGAPAGARVSSPVEQSWLGRTLLDLAGLERAEFPGRDLRDYLAAEPPPDTPRYALAAGRRTASITAWPWHLTLHLSTHRIPTSGQRNEQHAVRLFDLERDPDCEHDLIESGEEPERARRLRELLIEWANSAETLGWGSEGDRSPEVLAELTRLGYATDDPGSASEQLVDPSCDCDWCGRFR